MRAALVHRDLQLARELAPQPQQLERTAPPACRGVEPRPLEGRRVLRVGQLAREAGEVGELAPPALARRVGDERIDVVGEVLERRGLAVLLALEEERRIEAEEDDSRGHAPLGGGQPVADGAVADLVVVLGARHDPRPSGRESSAAMRAIEPSKSA